LGFTSSQGVNGISVTANTPNSGSNSDYSYFYYDTYEDANVSRISVNGGGTLTFSSVNMTSIVIHTDENYASANGWTWSGEQHTLSWSGDAASVVMADAYVSNITSIDFTFATDEQTPDPDPEPVGTTITWDAEDLDTVNVGTGESQTIKTITVTNAANYAAGQYCQFLYNYGYCGFSMNNNGSLTFAPESGQLTSIVIAMTYDYEGALPLVEGSKWTLDPQNPKLLKWTGNAASVTLQADGTGTYLASGPISSIVFTVANAGGEDPGDEPVVENKTATSVVIYGGKNYYDGQFTIVDTDLGSFGVSYTLPNVYLRDSELSNTISEKSLTITSSDESVVAVSLSDFIDEEHIYRTIQFVQNDYGHAVITVSFAGDETYASSHASFDYYYIMNTNPMAACHVEDLDHTPRTNLVMTEGDRIALDVVRDDGNEMSYQMVATATTTHKSCWKPNEEINHVQFYPHAAGLDTIVYEYYRFSHFDNPNGNKEDFRYWPYRQTIKIPVEIHPFLTPMDAVAQTKMNLNPATNASMAFSNTMSDLYNSTAEQLEINSTVTAENLQVALDSMATGKKEWNDLLPGATTFNVAAGRGKIKIQCQTVEGYELKVLIRNGGTATITQPTMDTAEVNYDVAEVSAVLVYLWPTGGSPAPKHRAPAAKKAGPKAIIKAISVIPMVEVKAKPDPDNEDVYYSTFYDSEKKYQLPAGTEAYVAELNTNELLMTKIAENGQVIPAGNAVILKSEAASVDLIATDDAPVSFSATNHLHGVDSKTDAPANCYVLSGHSTDNSVTGVGFYEFTGKIPAHKAYLTISGGAAYAPKKLRFVFNNEQQATGIDNAADGIMSEKRIEDGQLVIIKNGVRYNAQGQVIQ